MKNIISLFIIGIIVSSCAGSAQHEVVSSNKAGDARLDCRELDAEIVIAGEPDRNYKNTLILDKYIS